jgi:hypothetical protein
MFSQGLRRRLGVGEPLLEHRDGQVTGQTFRELQALDRTFVDRWTKGCNVLRPDFPDRLLECRSA